MERTTLPRGLHKFRRSRCRLIGSSSKGHARREPSFDLTEQIAEQRIEPMSGWDTLGTEQTDFIKSVLAEPAYTLDSKHGPTTLSRISRVIEF